MKLILVMLTGKHQMFLIKLLVSKEETGVNGLTRGQQNLWNSVAFYRNASYLQQSGFVEAVIEDDNGHRAKRYKLTTTGSVCARTILCLADVKKQFPKMYKEYRPMWVFN